MEPSTTQDRHFFIKALKIAATLKPVIDHAEDISLEAMNAKSIVARAGDHARAIRPITDRMDELSKNIIELIKQIRSESMNVCRDSISDFTEEVAASHLQRGRTIGRNSKFISDLDTKISLTAARLRELRIRTQDHVLKLSLLLEDIESSLLATTVIIAKFRLEAGVSGSEFRPHFETLVQKFENSVTQSRASVLGSKKTLAECRRTIKR